MAKTSMKVPRNSSSRLTISRKVSGVAREIKEELGHMLRDLLLGQHIAEQVDAHHQKADRSRVVERIAQYLEQFGPCQLAIDDGSQKKGIAGRDHGSFCGRENSGKDAAHDDQGSEKRAQPRG